MTHHFCPHFFSYSGSRGHSWSAEKQQFIVSQRRKTNVCKACCNLLPQWSVLCHLWDMERAPHCGISHKSPVLQPHHKTSTRLCPYPDPSSIPAHSVPRISQVIINKVLSSCNIFPHLPFGTLWFHPCFRDREPRTERTQTVEEELAIKRPSWLSESSRKPHLGLLTFYLLNKPSRRDYVLYYVLFTSGT